MAIEKHTTITTDDCLSTNGGIVNGDIIVQRGSGNNTTITAGRIKGKINNNQSIGLSFATDRLILDGTPTTVFPLISNVGIPQSDYDAANKAYVDSIAGGSAEFYTLDFSHNTTDTLYGCIVAELVENKLFNYTSNKYVYHVHGSGVVLGPGTPTLTIYTSDLPYVNYTTCEIYQNRASDTRVKFFSTYGDTTSGASARFNNSSNVTGQVQGMWIVDFILSTTKI